jgi:hypothetical protein
MRPKTINHRLQRILDELRVALPGVQIMFGFLLIAPFNQRFEQVSHLGRVIYGCALACAFGSSMLLIAPSMFHRVYESNSPEREARMLRDFNRLAIAGGVLLGLGVIAAVAFLGQFLAGARWAAIASCVCGVVWFAIWFALPLWRRRQDRRSHASSTRNSVH